MEDRETKRQGEAEDRGPDTQRGSQLDVLSPKNENFTGFLHTTMSMENTVVVTGDVRY